MKRGTILRNMWQPSYESYLVYLRTQGKYAKCLCLINGKFANSSTKEENFYKKDILHDREHYPVVGYVDIDKVIHDVIINGIGARA